MFIFGVFSANLSFGFQKEAKFTTKNANLNTSFFQRCSMVTKFHAHRFNHWFNSFQNLYHFTSPDFAKKNNWGFIFGSLTSFVYFFARAHCWRQCRLPVYVVFLNMAANNSKIISFKTAYQIFKNFDLGQKRQLDKGNNDFEIIEDILHHEGVELIKFSDQNLDPTRIVSFGVLSILNFQGFEKVQLIRRNQKPCRQFLMWKIPKSCH